MVSALFVRRNSIYKKLGVDCWDIDRDARLWPGGNPAIAHPPCRAWGRLKGLAKPSPGEKELAIKAVHFIRQNGGILEHPSGSSLWKETDLPLDSSLDDYGGYTLSVNQSWWGHRAQKKTLLYIVGCPRNKLPMMPIAFDCIQFTICSSKKRKETGKKAVSKEEREATPVLFAKWLIQVAGKCNQKNEYRI